MTETRLNAAIPDSVDFSFSYDDMAFYAYVCRKNQKNEATELLTWEIDKLFQLASEGGIVYESECSDCFGVCKIDMSDLMWYLIKYGLDDLIRSSGQPVNNETRAFFLNVYSNGEMFQQFVNQADTTESAQGNQVKKMCYWLNREYVINVVNRENQ